MGSIFDVEIRLDINKEFRKMVKFLHNTINTTITTRREYSTFIGAINYEAFKDWPYRGTTINCEEYLEAIGLPEYYFQQECGIDEKRFLYYIEFLYNIYYFASYKCYIEIEDRNVKAILENINIIIERMNYQFVQDGDKFILTKRNSDLDSVLTIVEENIGKLLLEYNDFKISSNLERKNEILKSIDKYIEKNKSEYSKVDTDTYKTIGYIMNNFGINHKINDKYKNVPKNELLKWYDKCFMLSLHLIRTKRIKEINQERKELEK